MTALEAIEKFRDGVFNEIYQSSANEELQDSLVKNIKEVERRITEELEKA